MQTADVTISIATHNRCEGPSPHLPCSWKNSTQPPAEIIICADGCSDETVETIEQNFPRITLITNDQAQGSIVSRDRILRQASSPIVLSIDDDSYPVDKDFLALVEERFEADPNLGVLTCFQITDEFPETISDPENQRGIRQLVASFPNSAAAIRRDLYLRSSGYPSHFFHSYEEPDFALQCYSLGSHVVYDPSLTIRHHFSPAGRKESRNHRRHARNEFWSATMRAPLALVPIIIPYRVFSQFRYSFKRGFSWVIAEPLWWLAALRGIPKCLRHRKSVPFGKYREWLRLFRHPVSYITPDE